MKKIINLLRQYKEVISYLIFGVLTTLVNILTYMLFADLFHIDYLISTVIAWILSVLFAYITNKLYVFESKTTVKNEIIKEMLSFFGFRLFSGVLDLANMFVFVSLLHFNDTLIKILSNVFVIIINYVFSKCFIFKQTKINKENNNDEKNGASNYNEK